MVKIGLEHEFVFINDKGTYLDFDTSDYEVFSRIVENLPYYENDKKYFHLKSLESKPTRFYIEGFELHDEKGNTTTTIPKGIEIRTTPHTNLEELIEEFSTSFNLLQNEAKRYGLYPVFTSTHPFKDEYMLDNRHLQHEQSLRTPKEFETATDSMVAHGLHVNFSLADISEEKLNDLYEKVTFYIPYLIPFSFSSPFCLGKVFEGECYRNYTRAQKRKMVGIREINDERYIEFKAFDAIGDKELLKAIVYLFKGLLLDETLQGRAKTQDVRLLRHASFYGFKDGNIKNGSIDLLKAVQKSLGNEALHVNKLEELVHTNKTYSTIIKKRFEESGDIITAISNLYDYK